MKAEKREAYREAARRRFTIGSDVVIDKGASVSASSENGGGCWVAARIFVPEDMVGDTVAEELDLRMVGDYLPDVPLRPAQAGAVRRYLNNPSAKVRALAERILSHGTRE